MTPEQLKEISRICPRWRDRPLAEIVAAVERVQAKPAATTSASVATLAVKQPLSDEQIDALRQQDNGALNFVTLRQFRVVARAVEAKHGIGTPAAPGTKPTVSGGA